ncbi:hypothetical protein GCM10022251_30770 [Phytohabitans flavus]|uniref:Uncharacterized protein n=1 Tax=Phytohabitans flavus TaxID=1076124 RepID=A0A6F8XWX8_9ACTN|nr:hypothetical protein Pflav_047450 [Phytohabitans flavus]
MTPPPYRATAHRPRLPSSRKTSAGDVLAYLPTGDRALVLVNGLGGTTAIELYNVFSQAEAAHASLTRYD